MLVGAVLVVLTCLCVLAAAQVGSHERNLRSNHVVMPSVPTAISPGVYRTFPYSCIVVVPGPHPDDRCVVNPGGANDPMPIIKPDLQFIPWGPAK